MNVSCNCANPVVIVNRNLKYFWYKIVYVNTSFGSESVSFSSFNQCYRYFKNRLVDNNYEITDFYASSSDGEIVPPYLVVPCGKCAICRNRLTKHWQFRAIAENNLNPDRTFFVTLTYNNDFLPPDGVSVRWIQLFMKRLRIKLNRLSIDEKIKYFACGEYGKNTKRPHYHLILWNFPKDSFGNLTKCLKFIESAWSSPYDNKSFGFCYVKPCDSGAIQYVIKYLRKSISAPVNKNPYFVCCSKYIGIDWFDKHRDFIATYIYSSVWTITDKVSGRSVKCSLPSYYKHKLIPVRSQFFNKVFIQSVDLYLQLLSRVKAVLCYMIDGFSDNSWLYSQIDKYIYNDYNFQRVDMYWYSRYSYKCADYLFKEYDNLCNQIVAYELCLESLFRNINFDLLDSSLNLKNKVDYYLSKNTFTCDLDTLRRKNSNLLAIFNHESLHEIL